MRMFKNLYSGAGLSTAMASSALLGLLATSSVHATGMTVSPTRPVANINATTTVDVKFAGLVLAINREYAGCASNICTLLYVPVKLYEGNQLLTPNFSGPVTCYAGTALVVIGGMNYTACNNAVLKVTIPAKSKVGGYTYTVTHDADIYANSTAASFVVSVGSGASISTVLPLLLE